VINFKLKTVFIKKIFAPFFLFIALNVNAQKTLHLYGGSSHDVYLGCLNCSDIDPNSIWNEIGRYGSNISFYSIWNSISNYGSSISSYSPWNSLATYPPVIVDKDAGFYGYLTLNEFNMKRADFKLVLILYKYYEDIRDDVRKWYSKIFDQSKITKRRQLNLFCNSKKSSRKISMAYYYILASPSLGISKAFNLCWD
jgi:hypothetical protein